MLTELNKRLYQTHLPMQEIECTKEEKYAILELSSKNTPQKRLACLDRGCEPIQLTSRASTLSAPRASIEPNMGSPMQLVASAGTMELLNLS